MKYPPSFIFALAAEKAIEVMRQVERNESAFSQLMAENVALRRFVIADRLARGSPLKICARDPDTGKTDLEMAATP